MRRTGVGRAPVEYAQCSGFTHVRDIDDGKAAEPVTYIKPVVLSNRMMATVIGAMPGRFLSAGHPLARHPPTADFLRLLRVLYVQDQCNVADVAFHVGREIGVAPVEGKSVHAFGGSLEKSDLARLRT